MNTKKVISTLFGWLFILWGAYLVYTMWIDTQKASANSDYICIKDVNRSCQIDHCTPWNKNGERTCYWKRVAQIAYYRYRYESCNGNLQRSFVYKTTSCSITQIDHASPVGTTSVNYSK